MHDFIRFIMAGNIGEADDSNVSVNEKIIKQCHSLYTDKKNGLIQIASEFNIKLLAPRKKIVVLLIGNHSAGKSSFINWYIEESVQKTGVAIETQGFTVVSSGLKRESLMGNATLHLYPHFKPLEQMPGVIDFLSTEITPSKQKKFPLVTFVDTPGLVDGDLQYPFDVNAAVLWLGAMADLVFVFFDPIGQALCRRTLNLVEALNKAHAEKMKFYLSKSDEAGNEADRQKVLMQIVQELCKRPGLNRTGFNMPTIFIPELSRQNSKTVLNQIDDVCSDLERVINRNIQNSLNSLEKDGLQLQTLIEKKLQQDEINWEINCYNTCKALLLGSIALFLPILVIFIFISRSVLSIIFGRENAAAFMTVLEPIQMLWALIPPDRKFGTIVCMLIGAAILFSFARSYFGFLPVMDTKDKKRFQNMLNHLKNTALTKQKQLYQLYLKQCVSDQDL